MSFGRSRLLTRLDLGATWIDQKIELPASLRFFAGGDQSIRGFEYQALGPLNANGEVVGGKQLIVGSLEYDFQVRDRWRVAVFVDSGNAFDNTSAFEFQHSAGIGIRWLSPIGQIRLDLAHPFDAEDSFRLHITMGPDL
jgi:translocation and assembly module TamA